MSFFEKMSALNDPVTPRWLGAKCENCWKGSKGFLSSAQSWSIVFEHRFRMILVDKMVKNVISRQNERPKWPPWPLWVGSKCENCWKVSEGFLSSVQSWSIIVEHRFRMILVDKMVNNIIFRQNERPKWPLDPLLGGVKMWTLLKRDERVPI